MDLQYPVWANCLFTGGGGYSGVSAIGVTKEVFLPGGKAMAAGCHVVRSYSCATRDSPTVGFFFAEVLVD